MIFLHSFRYLLEKIQADFSSVHFFFIDRYPMIQGIALFAVAKTRSIAQRAPFRDTVIVKATRELFSTIYCEYFPEVFSRFESERRLPLVLCQEGETLAFDLSFFSFLFSFSFFLSFPFLFSFFFFLFLLMFLFFIPAGMLLPGNRGLLPFFPYR